MVCQTTYPVNNLTICKCYSPSCTFAHHEGIRVHGGISPLILNLCTR